jgi:hypothetical protein
VKDGPAAKELHRRRGTLRSIFTDEDAVHSVAAGDEDRSVALVDNLEASRSEERRLDRSMAPVAQDDQIHFESSRFIEDRLGGAVTHEVRFYRDIRRCEPPRDLVGYALRRNFDVVIALSCQIHRHHHSRVSQFGGWARMCGEDVDRGVDRPGQIRHQRLGAVGRLGTVDAQQNSHLELLVAREHAFVQTACRRALDRPDGS